MLLISHEFSFMFSLCPYIYYVTYILFFLIFMSGLFYFPSTLCSSEHEWQRWFFYVLLLSDTVHIKHKSTWKLASVDAELSVVEIKLVSVHIYNSPSVKIYLSLLWNSSNYRLIHSQYTTILTIPLQVFKVFFLKQVPILQKTGT